MLVTHANEIKIYPEWNVNAIMLNYPLPCGYIKIYPEWNVNRLLHLNMFTKVIELKSTQSGM